MEVYCWCEKCEFTGLENCECAKYIEIYRWYAIVLNYVSGV